MYNHSINNQHQGVVVRSRLLVTKHIYIYISELKQKTFQEIPAFTINAIVDQPTPITQPSFPALDYSLKAVAKIAKKVHGTIPTITQMPGAISCIYYHHYNVYARMRVLLVSLICNVISIYIYVYIYK